jgi:aspartate/methionine/tyrosine aminotransferase
MVAEFRARRDLIVGDLNKIPGISCQLPSGAFYVFPRISELGLSAGDLQERLLDQAGVAALPGTSFGSYGEGYLRLSYANSAENLRAAAVAIGDLVASL